VLRSLIDHDLVEARVGRSDKRERNLFLTAKGQDLERRLSDAQRARMRAAYRTAGPAAVQGFRTVLEAMMDPEMRRQYQSLRESER
jgi:DNA-binding MarR family transcriptional regulator